MIRFFALVALFISGCTDAEVSQFTAIGSRGHIVCYSGGKIIYDGTSTGKILTENQSDGWFLKDSKNGQLVRVSGDCVIEN